MLKIENKSKKYVDNLKDSKLQKKLRQIVLSLKNEPFRKGHCLHGKLNGYRALDNLEHKGVSYRVIFKVDKKNKQVKVMEVGTHEEYNNRLKMGFKE